MKKSILLIAAGFFAIAANGQDAQKSILFNPAGNSSNATYQFNNSVNGMPAAAKQAHKTTVVGGGRWYDYCDSMLGLNSSACGPVLAVSSTDIDIWQDTSSIWGFTGPAYSFNPWVGVGLVLDPFAANWNSSTNFPATEIAVSPVNSYIIDSVKLYGFYGRNNAKPLVNDMLIFQFVQGNGTGTSDMAAGLSYGTPLSTSYCTTAVDFLTVYHDSLTNRAAHSGGALTLPIVTPVATTSGFYQFTLTKTDTINTGTVGPTGTLGKVYPRPGHVPADPAISYTVTAGNYVAMSVSFKNGDATYPVYPAHDTIRYAAGTYKYGGFSPLIIYATTAVGGTTAGFPPYVYPADHTEGLFKLEGIREGPNSGVNSYSPNWGWTTSGGTAASDLQYPYIWFHVKCTTCPTIGTPSLGVENVLENNINVYPNPAANELNITFASGPSVQVVLTNMLGQAVATQIVTNGKAVFNTTGLPDGIYSYTLQSNEEHVSGNVSIVH